MLCSKSHNGFRYKETPMTSGLVYQHMSSHYRRILNAKPVVDTSAPQAYKPRLTRSGNKPRRRPSSSSTVGYREEFPRNDDRNLIETDVSRLDWPRRRDEKPNDLNKVRQFSNNQTRPAIIMKRERGDLLERPNEQFEAYRLNFCPRILKTDASSKLRGMRVYHPPRRITNFTNTEWTKESLEKEESAGQESSRDSAYNGGTSSTPDSQSPTCQPKTLISHVKQDVATQTEPKEPKPQTSDNEMALTKFIHDIVVEMTEKELFTDYALTQVMFRHYTSNVKSLDKDKMLQEIRKLREKLGMLEMDDDFQIFGQVEKNVTQLIIPPSTPSPSEPFTDPPSWTSVYKQLKEQNQSFSISSCSEDVLESIIENVCHTDTDKNEN